MWCSGFHVGGIIYNRWWLQTIWCSSICGASGFTLGGSHRSLLIANNIMFMRMRCNGFHVGGNQRSLLIENKMMLICMWGNGFQVGGWSTLVVDHKQYDVHAYVMQWVSRWGGCQHSLWVANNMMFFLYVRQWVCLMTNRGFARATTISGNRLMFHRIGTSAPAQYMGMFPKTQVILTRWLRDAGDLGIPPWRRKWYSYRRMVEANGFEPVGGKIGRNSAWDVCFGRQMVWWMYVYVFRWVLGRKLASRQCLHPRHMRTLPQRCSNVDKAALIMQPLHPNTCQTCWPWLVRSAIGKVYNFWQESFVNGRQTQGTTGCLERDHGEYAPSACDVRICGGLWVETWWVHHSLLFVVLWWV